MSDVTFHLAVHRTGGVQHEPNKKFFPRIDERTARQMDGRMDGQMDGQTDE